MAKLGRFIPYTGAALFFFYSGGCLVAAIALTLIARQYKMVDYFRPAGAWQAREEAVERKP